MPLQVPGTPGTPGTGLAVLIEQVARVVARARSQQGDAAVQGRVDAAVSPEDAATAARVLRTLGSQLGDAPVDLGALDARLRAMASAGAAADSAGGAGAVGAGALDPDASDPRATDQTATSPKTSDPKSSRPVPPTGLRSAMRGRRR